MVSQDHLFVKGNQEQRGTRSYSCKLNTKERGNMIDSREGHGGNPANSFEIRERFTTLISSSIESSTKWGSQTKGMRSKSKGFVQVQATESRERTMRFQGSQRRRLPTMLELGEDAVNER